MKNVKEIKQEVSDRIYFAKEKAKRDVVEVTKWIVDNKETLAVVTPVAIAALRGANKVHSSINRKVALKKEQELKDLRVYDR